VGFSAVSRSVLLPQRGRRVLAQPVCTLTPEQIEGRSTWTGSHSRNISEASPAAARLVLHVLDASVSCAPIPRAAWTSAMRCARIYSGYEGAAIAPRHVDQWTQTFLRGTQVTTIPAASGSERSIGLYLVAPRMSPEVRVARKQPHPALFSRRVTNTVYAAPHTMAPNRTQRTPRIAS